MNTPEEDFRAAAQRVVSGCRLALFCSVDQEGCPVTRWMGCFWVDELRRVVALSSPRARKVTQVRSNPRVSWMFGDGTGEETVTLLGRARTVVDGAEVKRAWLAIPDKTHAYFLQFQSDGIGFTVLETLVDRAEYSLPRQNRTHRFDVASLAGAK